MVVQRTEIYTSTQVQFTHYEQSRDGAIFRAPLKHKKTQHTHTHQKEKKNPLAFKTINWQEKKCKPFSFGSSCYARTYLRPVEKHMSKGSKALLTALKELISQKGEHVK